MAATWYGEMILPPQYPLNCTTTTLFVYLSLLPRISHYCCYAGFPELSDIEGWCGLTLPVNQHCTALPCVAKSLGQWVHIALLVCLCFDWIHIIGNKNTHGIKSFQECGAVAASLSLSSLFPHSGSKSSSDNKMTDCPRPGITTASMSASPSPPASPSPAPTPGSGAEGGILPTIMEDADNSGTSDKENTAADVQPEQSGEFPPLCWLNLRTWGNLRCQVWVKIQQK